MIILPNEENCVLSIAKKSMASITLALQHNIIGTTKHIAIGANGYDCSSRPRLLVTVLYSRSTRDLATFVSKEQTAITRM